MENEKLPQTPDHGGPQVACLARIAYTLAFIGTLLLGGCSTVTPKMLPDTSYGDPGRLDVTLAVMNATRAPQEKGQIDLVLVTRTVFEVFQNSGDFLRITLSDKNSDYAVIPTVVQLTDLFDQVVHLRLQAKSIRRGNIVYDSVFLGNDITQGLSLRMIALLLQQELPTIRASIYSDVRKTATPSPVSAHSHPQAISGQTSLSLSPGAREFPPMLAKPGQEAHWAIVIGVSQYRDTRIPPLRYANQDARAFSQWLVSPEGGRYPPSRVRLLLDEQATAASIRDALFNWLGQALEEDVVTIFFAGHGSPQSPDTAENLFLLLHDTDYGNVATTAFPMWDIETALKRFIKAKKIVVIADACHSGGVGEAFDVARRANRAIEVNPITSGLQNLSKIGDGVCIISASDDKQFSQESKDWGGGHGVFTYFLLKGLKGDADYSKDSRVTLGELIPYLSEQVRRATRNAQCPTVAGKFDPALSVGR